MKCIICDKKIEKQANGWDKGHNARPVANGRCCSECNDLFVIPVRLIYAQAEGMV